MGPHGFALLAPLPDHRFLIFVDNPKAAAPPAPPQVELLSELLDQRVGLEVGVHDVRWISNFQMDKRMAPRMADGRRFLVGDAGHSSSPLGGHGLNTALLDAADVAWKMALVLRGHGRPALLASYATERQQADEHILRVSHDVHLWVMSMIEQARQARIGAPPAPAEASDEVAERAAKRSKALLSIAYQSPLVGEWLEPGRERPSGPVPGERYPDRNTLRGPLHHLLLFAARPVDLKAFEARWQGLVGVVDGSASGLRADRAGVPDGGMVLVRPDGYIGFRAAGTGVDAVKAIDAFLDSYLIPIRTAVEV